MFHSAAGGPPQLHTPLSRLDAFQSRLVPPRLNPERSDCAVRFRAVVEPDTTKQLTKTTMRAVEVATSLRILSKSIPLVQQSNDLNLIVRLTVRLV
jgi:hypothetical protein